MTGVTCITAKKAEDSTKVLKLWTITRLWKEENLEISNTLIQESRIWSWTMKTLRTILVTLKKTAIGKRDCKIFMRGRRRKRRARLVLLYRICTKRNLLILKRPTQPTSSHAYFIKSKVRLQLAAKNTQCPNVISEKLATKFWIKSWVKIWGLLTYQPIKMMANWESTARIRKPKDVWGRKKTHITPAKTDWCSSKVNKTDWSARKEAISLPSTSR